MTAKPIMAWRKSPRLLVGSDDPAAVMDAIVAWMNDPDALYENGDARAQHTGSAWDVAGVEQDVGLTYTVCVRLQPPTTSTRKNQRVCLMGMATVAGAPTMIGSDVFANKNMYVCHVKGVTHDDEGDYTSFVDNPPYTGYNWTKWMGTKRNIACTAVHVYEGIEGIAFEFENQSNGDWPVGFCIAGDLLDTFGQGRAEADGGVYCCFASGYTADLNVAFWSSTTAGTFFVHTDSAGWHKWATYTIGGAGVPGHQYAQVNRTATTTPPTTTNAVLGSRYARWPLYVQNSAGEWIGQMRGVFMAPRRGRITIEDGVGAPIAYFVAAEALDVSTDTVALSAVD